MANFRDPRINAVLSFWFGPNPASPRPQWFKTDPAFDRAIGFLWRWDLDVVLSHVGLAVALAWLAAGSLPGDTILVKASRGPALDLLVDGLVHTFGGPGGRA